MPWNRGAHPNFWAFYDNTPSGVSIHLIDEGIDTGPILYQKIIKFDKEQNTFISTHKKLILEIEKLFIENLNEILNKQYIPKHQKGIGTYHKTQDLPKNFRGWDYIIHDELKYLYESKVS